jgi:hypothetical protein
MSDLLWATLGMWHQRYSLSRDIAYFGRGPNPMTGHCCQLGSGKKIQGCQFNVIQKRTLWGELYDQINEYKYQWNATRKSMYLENVVFSHKTRGFKLINASVCVFSLETNLYKH